MRKNLFYAFLHIIGKFILWALFRLEKEGVENIPKKGGVILASNHASFLDPVLVAEASPRQLYFLAKEELFKGFFFPFFIKILHALPLSRKYPSLSTFRKIAKLVREGGALLLFPEGTRSKDGKIHEGKPGVAMIAYMSKSPVVPTLIEGSFSALPPGKKMISPVKIKVKFGKPIFPIGHPSRDNYLKLTKKIMDEIRKLKEEG